jgi:hypothetical protein
VYIGGALIETADLCDSTTLFNQVMFSIGNLPITSHTILIKIKGNVSGIGTDINFDAFGITVISY